MWLCVCVVSNMLLIFSKLRLNKHLVLWILSFLLVSSPLTLPMSYPLYLCLLLFFNFSSLLYKRSFALTPTSYSSVLVSPPESLLLNRICSLFHLIPCSSSSHLPQPIRALPSAWASETDSEDRESVLFTCRISQPLLWFWQQCKCQSWRSNSSAPT